jgi:GT2 family glycosyltransferase
LTVSVVICAYTTDRWADVLAAIRSVQRQTTPPDEILVVVDHNPDLLARLRDVDLGVTLLQNEQRRGLSGARNTGVAAATSEIVAFLDDDAVAEEDWLETLIRPYGDPEVFGTGGSVLPRWDAPRDDLPQEFDWVVGCSYRGLPTEAADVRNPIGASMTFRRSEVVAAGGFHHGLGRVGTVPAGCEETELCIRIRRRRPSGRVVYDPAACVSHRVMAPRTTWRYFVSRCFAEGRSKAALCRLEGSRQGLAAERRYASRVLPAGFARALRDGVVRRDAAAFGRAARIASGITLTTAGYVVGTLASGGGSSDA